MYLETLAVVFWGYFGFFLQKKPSCLMVLAVMGNQLENGDFR